MTNRYVNAISGRLSLRAPQRDSLEILDRIAVIAPPKKDGDVGAALAAIGSEFPSVTDFEREFPSLCFALATGVGKTRLAHEASTYAGLRGCKVLVGRCDEEGAAPYQPLVEALREYLDTAESWRVEQAMPPPVACELVRIVVELRRGLVDRADRVHVVVPARARRRPVRVVEVRRPRAGGSVGPRTGTADPGQRPRSPPL